jgi:predicted PurR-regulated permease PerM
MAFYVLLAYLGVQQLESNIIIPLLQRWAVRLPPALTLIAVVVGGILLSAPGLVFASPLAVVVMTLVKKLYVEETLEHATPKAVGAGAS